MPLLSPLPRDIGHRDLVDRLSHDEVEVALLKQMEGPQGIAVVAFRAPFGLLGCWSLGCLLLIAFGLVRHKLLLCGRLLAEA